MTIQTIFCRCGIEVAGWSADGDIRLLNSMKHSLNAMINQPDDILSSLQREQNISYLQDFIHWALKMRNRTLKPSIHLPMGHSQVSVAHLKVLIQSVRKEVHGIVSSDISPYDKQNFHTFIKVSSDRVLNALAENVPDSEGTVMYLQFTRTVTEAFRDVNLLPLERVRRVWEGLYFFRAWRDWIEKHDEYSKDENFISENAFVCLELNAYGLLHLITKLRDSKQEHLFIPSIFSSQNCEETFRTFRSMTSVNWTKINFTIYELLHMIRRIETANDIAYFKLSDQVIFPRLQNRSLGNFPTFNLPTNDDIQATLNQALEAALLKAERFGIHVDNNDIRICKLQKGIIPDRKISHLKSDENSIINQIDFTQFRKFANESSDFDGNSAFVAIPNDLDEEGETEGGFIKKSYIVWLLSQSKSKLSNDRLKRVQQRKDGESSGPKRKRASIAISKSNMAGTEDKAEIKVGDWCIFKEGTQCEFVAGAVLTFKHPKGKTQKDKQYVLDVAPLDNCSEQLEVLATWYRFNDDFTIEPLTKPSFFINMNQYVKHIDRTKLRKTPQN